MDGESYYFVTKEKFQDMIDHNEFVEYDAHMDNYYGTPEAQLNEKLVKLREQIAHQPQVKLKCFQQDMFKPGGNYITVIGRVKRIDEVGRAIILTDGERIPFGCIYDIE